MGSSAEVWSESCSICDGRVFSVGSYSSDVCSCWECKSVFTELTSSERTFRCRGIGNCPVTRLTRFRCLYCFIKKCVSAGFATGCIWHQGLNSTGSLTPAQHPCSEPVRIVSVGIEFVVQNPSDLASTSGEVEPESSDCDSSSSEVYSAICRVVFSHMKFCPTTAEKTRGLPLELSPSEMAVEDEEQETLVSDSKAESKCRAVFLSLANNMCSTVQDVAQFLQCLPGYERVSTDEKIYLLKGGFFKVWLLWNVASFHSSSGQQLILNENYFTFLELSNIYSVEFVRGLFDFARNWSSLDLTDAVVGLCAGIVLSTMSPIADISWACTGHIIQGTNELLTRALRQLLTQNNPTKPNLTEEVLQLVSNLDSISYAHSKFLKRYHKRWQRLGIPPLFAEVFNFPRRDKSGHKMALLPGEPSNEDMSCGEAETFDSDHQVSKEGAWSQSDWSNRAEDESCSELGNLGDVSCSDVLSNVSNESDGELGNYREPSQSNLCTVEEMFQNEISKDGDIFQDVAAEDEDIFPRELKEIFQRELLSQDEDIFQNKLDIFQRKLIKDEVIFENELSKDDVHIELSDDGDAFQSESRDVGDLSFIELSPEHRSHSE